MKTYLIFICLTFVSSCGNISNQFSKEPIVKVSDDTVITKKYVEAGGLYVRNYEIKILGTGEVEFKGKFAGNEFYKDKWFISKDEVANLIAAFRESDFFNLSNEYGESAIDMSITTISIYFDGKEKTVKRLSFGKTSEEKTLKNLEHLINTTVNAEPRIRKCCYFPNHPSESIP